jgi:hypothetical protein
MPAGEPPGASCVQKSDDSRFCNSHCLSHFAAFFIVMGTKISIVENLVLWLSLVRLLCVIRFVFAAPAPLHKASAADATEGLVELYWISVNDPSAGSPTETLLRLLLPLSDMVYLIFRSKDGPSRSPKGSPDHSKSVGATGGVYKGQGLNRRKVMTCAY